MRNIEFIIIFAIVAMGMVFALFALLWGRNDAMWLTFIAALIGGIYVRLRILKTIRNGKEH